MTDNLINYAGENIPDPENLISNCTKIAKEVSQLPKYGFEELFNPRAVKIRIEYNRNVSIWERLYNNWAKNELKEVDKVETLQGKKNEVKGIYIFYDDDIPVYVGISRKILARLKNHFLGKTHFQATLVYLMLRDKHDKRGEEYMGKRDQLPIFIEERETLQEEMRENWKISIIPIPKNYELYMTEVFLACLLKTKWNSFETH